MTALRICLIVLYFCQRAFVLGDYQCLCNYDVEKTVYAEPSLQGHVFGYLYEFDCKPIFSKMEETNFQSIQFEHQVAYVEMGSNVEEQICQGSIPVDDRVTTTTSTSTTTKATTTAASTIRPRTSTTAPPTKINIAIIIPGGNDANRTTNAITTIPTTSTMRATTTTTTTKTTSTTTSTTPTTMTTTTPRATTTTKATTAPTTTTKATTTPPTTTTKPTTTPTTTTKTTPTTTTKPTTPPPPTTTESTTTPKTTTKPTTTIKATTTVQKPSCRSGWILHDSSCYQFHTHARKHWDDANNDCQQRHSHLAIIETSREFNFLVQQLSQKIDTSQKDHSDTSVWVGGRDNNNEGTWEWYDATSKTYKPFTYTHWGHNEPDAGDGEHEEDCMTMVGNNHFKWADYSCNENMYYVCEKSALHTHDGSVSKVTNNDCPPGWVVHGGSCYLFYIDNRLTWSHANSFCTARHAHLAIIETSDEDNFIGQEASKRIDTANHGSESGVWVAGTDAHTEGHWHWAEGSSYRRIHGYTNWHQGEPDSGDGTHDEDCMCLIGSKNFQWQDYSCNKQMFFVCEKPVNSQSVPSLIG